jgi:hypothetical protein
MKTIPANESLSRHINQNGVKPGIKKFNQFVEAMKLRGVPALYSQDGQGEKAIAHVKLFDPCGSFTWYLTEFDGSDLCFGACCLFERELGYVSLSELSVTKGAMGIGIEIDTHFTPQPLDKCE